jgi:hypothetical protein
MSDTVFKKVDYQLSNLVDNIEMGEMEELAILELGL